MTEDRSADAAALDALARAIAPWLSTKGPLPSHVANYIIEQLASDCFEIRERPSEPVCVYPDPECQKEMSALFIKHGLPDPFANRATGDGEK
jgi:hypothetical protein